MRSSDWSSDVCSSDLRGVDPAARGEERLQRVGVVWRLARLAIAVDERQQRAGERRVGLDREFGRQPRRSEEHTSELQSLMRISYAVFCLKKKKKKEYSVQIHHVKDNNSQSSISHES